MAPFHIQRLQTQIAHQNQYLPALPHPAVTTVPRSTLDLARESTANDDPYERSAGRDLKTAQPHCTLLGMGATPILCVPFCLDNVLQKQLQAY